MRGTSDEATVRFMDWVKKFGNAQIVYDLIISGKNPDDETPLSAPPVTGGAKQDVLAWLEGGCLDLRCVDMPTGGDDSDIGWRVIEHHMAEPKERIIGYGNTALQACIDAGYAPPSSAEKEGV